ncbi:MAG: FecR family protein, partial [Woeseiaceae bacterium]
GDVPLAAGDLVNDSARVHTLSGGHVVLALEHGHEVRLDERTRLVVRAFDRFSLERGAVFIRSDKESPGSVFVETPFGTATDLGTQFVVRLANSSIFVGVREGLVQLEKSRSDKVNIEDGSLYVLSEGGLSQFRQLDAEDEIWNWVDETPRTFDIEGTTLASYLEWYASEIGASIEWADDESRQRAIDSVLRGSIDGASLQEGLEEVRRIAPFELKMTDSTLRVKVN